MEEYYMFEKLVCIVSFVMVTVSVLSAAPVVRVDLSQSGDVERGWIDWNTDDNRLGNEDVSMRFLNEADFDDDFTIDFIKIDSRNRDDVNVSIPMHDLIDDAFKEGDPFDMILKDLIPGIYTITTYHHDPAEDVINDDGTLNITVQDADGTRLVVDHLQQSWGPNPTFVGTATFKFRSDGVSDVVITFADNNDGIHNEAFLNGFELSIWVSRDQASNPSPENGDADILKDAMLTWEPGMYTPAVNGHRVYLSEVFSDVNDGAATVLQGETSFPEYMPAELSYGTTYYWRVDEANDVTGWIKGQIWSYTTEPLAYAMSGSAITASASSWHNESMTPRKTVDGSGLDAEGLHSADENHMWLSGANDTNPWIQYEFDHIYNLQEIWLWNFNQTFESVIGFGLKDVVIEYSMNGIDWDAVEGITVLPAAPGTDGVTHDIVIDLGGLVAQYVRITATSNWGGWNRYGLSEVQFFYIPMAARNPQPEAGTGGISPAPVLSWRPGRAAASHDIYFGTDKEAVQNAAAPVYTIAENFFETEPLALTTTYYWRVDEINQSQSPAVWEGVVWSFSTSSFLVVDDMESYNDEEGQGTRIYESWIDGWGDNSNGSQVGNDFGPFTEQMIVHGGKQSMPLFYNNTTASYSEATLTFDTTQDWTRYGIKTLVLYFHGDQANESGQVYIKINGSKKDYDGDAGNIALHEWTEWRIDLSSLNTNMENVANVSIGIEGSSSGKILIDDLQLWP
jgi:hypothetical protein